MVAEFRGLFKTPCFYYSLISIILLSLIYLGINRLPKTIIWSQVSYFKTAEAAFFGPVSKNNDSKEGVLFLARTNHVF